MTKYGHRYQRMFLHVDAHVYIFHHASRNSIKEKVKVKSVKNLDSCQQRFQFLIPNRTSRNVFSINMRNFLFYDAPTNLAVKSNGNANENLYGDG